MATAEDLLGAGFDMQLMGKLVLSLVVVLLISWAYKLYGSRSPARRRCALVQSNGNVRQPTDSQIPAGTCMKCKAELRQKKEQVPASAERGRTEWAENSPKDPENDCPEHREYPAENPNMEIGEHHKHPPSTSEKEALEHVKSRPENFGEDTLEEHEYCPETTSADNHAEALAIVPHSNCDASKEIVTHRGFSSTLSPALSTEQGQTSPTGRRSPCTLRKLEQSAGVRRELRQDLGHPGAFSSFRSKVEIRVEDADLLLERPGHKHVEVRGKIYDFYAESTSQSSDYQSCSDVLRPIAKQYEDCTSKDLQPIGLSGILPIGGDRCTGGRSAKLPVVPGFHISPLNMRDVGIGNSNTVCSAAHSSVDLCPRPLSLTNRRPILHESVARANVSQTPLEGVGGPELESLMGRLDLGNCLHALTLARKHRHAGLEESALRVMSDNYLQVLQEPGLYGRLKADDREKIQNRRMKGRQYLMVADIDPQYRMMNRTMAGAGSCDSRISSGLYYYDDYKDTWHHMCPLPKEVVSRGCAMCTLDNYLFIAVGYEGASYYAEPSSKVFCFNPATNIWTEVRPMNEARPLCKLVALQGHIYAIGGEGLRTVERYNPRADCWTFVAPLPRDTFLVAHRATAWNGELFVLGGTLKYTLLRYNPQTDAWTRSLTIDSKEGTTEVVAARNSLYRFDVCPYQGISVYRYHAVARLWYECCSKRLPHCPAFQCTTVDDVIYCVSREFTMRLLADEVSPKFDKKDLKVLSVANGVLFPFTLVFPDKKTLQTSV
ncbi:kelch domain-containing protein 7A-like [Anguilla rostrata]|uniref:kelch domain-containing protein 7A-like n=1 Tax=Anguilla rostrata TaxID=7938 RepID=UPI0030CD12B7